MMLEDFLGSCTCFDGGREGGDILSWLEIVQDLGFG